MTPAQRQAWEHFSGTPTVYCKGPGGVGPCYINTAAGKIRQDSIDWLKNDQKVRVLQVVKNPDGFISNQQVEYGIPEDLVEVCDPVAPPDPWESIVEQNRQREEEMFEAFLSPPPEMAAELDAKSSGNGLFGSFSNFAATMAFHSLVTQEETIIREAWNMSLGQPDPYTDLVKEQARYVEKRRKLKEKFGEHFEVAYEAQRASHNSCARTNLDNSDGHLYSFVLPKFNDDGTYEPWGARDVPWGNAP